MLLGAETTTVDEARVVKALVLFALLTAGLALLADDDAELSGPLSQVRQVLNDAFSAVGLIPAALALALVATVLITRAPAGSSAAEALAEDDMAEASAAPPEAAHSEEAVPSDEAQGSRPEPGEADPYDEAVAALEASVSAWSPPVGIDPASEFAEILTREAPRSPWAR